MLAACGFAAKTVNNTSSDLFTRIAKCNGKQPLKATLIASGCPAIRALMTWQERDKGGMRGKKGERDMKSKGSKRGERGSREVIGKKRQPLGKSEAKEGHERQERPERQERQSNGDEDEGECNYVYASLRMIKPLRICLTCSVPYVKAAVASWKKLTKVVWVAYKYLSIINI
jgi:hypothetical protein